jgi:ABC-type glycerol-3-phosphate transport system substrate-binding protein
MRFQKRFVLLSVVMVFALLISACAPAASPTQAPAGAQPTTAAAAPTTAAAQPTKAAAPTTAAAAPTTAAAEPTKAAAPTTAAAQPTKAAAAPTTAAAGEVSNPPTSPEQVDAIDLTGKNVEVVFWHNRPQQDQEFLQGMLDEFNESNPYGITARAEIAGASYNEVYNKVNAAIQAGQPPDMSVAYQNQAATYRAAGAVIDLNPFIESEEYGLSEADQQDYFETFLNSDANPQFQGERLGFPTQRSMEVLYYNVDWLTSLGYDGPPETWAEFPNRRALRRAEPLRQWRGAVRVGFVLWPAVLLRGHPGRRQVPVRH